MAVAAAEGELCVFTSNRKSGNLFLGQPIVPGRDVEISNVFIVNMWGTQGRADSVPETQIRTP